MTLIAQGKMIGAIGVTWQQDSMIVQAGADSWLLIPSNKSFRQQLRFYRRAFGLSRRYNRGVLSRAIV